MKRETIKPLGENILVKITKENAKTKSGIFLPETVSQDKPQTAKVIAVGDDKKIKIKKGQTVIFAKYSGTELNFAREEHLLLKNEDILAVVE